MADIFFTCNRVIDLIIFTFIRYVFLSNCILCHVLLTIKTLIFFPVPLLIKTAEPDIEIPSGKQFLSASGVKAIVIQ